MINPNRLALLLGILMALAGCAGSPPQNVPAGAEVSVRDEAQAVSELLDYYRRVSGLPAADQLREYQEALASFERQPGEMQRLRLGLLLTLPRVAWHDDARALQLVDNIAEARLGRASPLRDLALIIQKFVTERLQQVREELRKSEDANQKLRGQLAERQRQVRDEQRKVEELEQKLEALRNIDRKALQRPAKK